MKKTKGDNELYNLQKICIVKSLRRLFLYGMIVTLLYPLTIFAQGKEAYILRIKAPITTWDVAVPLGNGLTGCLVWGEKNLLRFSFDRGDLWDNRVPDEIKEQGFTYANIRKLVEEKNSKEISRLTDKPYSYPYPTKLPGVRLELEMKSDFEAKTFMLDMTKALCTVEPVSGKPLAVFTSATRQVTLIRCPEYVNASLKVPTSVKLLGYPEPQSGSEGDNLWWRQKTVEKLEYGAYLAVKKTGGECLMAISFTSNEDADDFMALAKKQANDALQEGFDKSMADHGKWWNDFWSVSEINLPDLMQGRYYNLMQYYYGSASRKGYPPMPLQGLWTADAGGLPPWKGDFHNDMNVQMCYWAYYASGHFNCGESLTDFLFNLAPAHRIFAKDFFGVEGLMVPGVMGLKGQALTGWVQYSLSPTMSVWLLQNIYWHWRYTMDNKFLKEKCYPYCKEMAAAMEALLKEDQNGKLKLLLSSSPEIHNNSLQAWLTPNSNNDQALLIWMGDVMLEMAKALNIKEDVKHWQKFLTKLDVLAVDEDKVLRLSPVESLKESHRHHAHLMAVYPLGIMNIEGSQQDKEVVLASLDNLKKIGTDFWVGFSFPWASCLEARAGRADEALRYLDIYVNAFTSPNGFNLNGDQSGNGYSKFTYRPFTLDANFGAAQAVHEMLLQSWGGKIRIFPAVPSKWQDVSFRDLRAEGGFIISAERKAGRTVSLRIKAVVDSKLVLKDPFDGNAVKWNRRNIRKVGDYYECTLKAGDELESGF
jgi:alpha-L-fucosidase 2